MGKLPLKYRNYITPTLLFFFEIAKLGHINHLNVKDVNEIISNNNGYYKEVFDMYNYLMLVMYAIEQQRDKEQNRKQGNKSPEFLAKELFGEIIGDTKNKPKEIVTIEVTPEDMKKIKENRDRNLRRNKKKK